MDPVAVFVAFLAGVALERHRQGRRTRPLTLAETPSAWWRTLGALGWRYALAAAAAGLAALGILGLPGPETDRVRADERASRASAALAAKAVSPSVTLLTRRAGRSFRIRGAVFRAFRAAGEPWAQSIHSKDAGRHTSWVVVGVNGRNLARPRFNPNTLPYRLKDTRGNRYAPVVAGGTGAASLAKGGSLRRGESAEARLAFRVPAYARRVTLVFEPVADGSIQVEVPLR